MKFIVDANLPDEVSVWLRSLGHEAWHINELHEVGASDDWIWREALSRSAVVVTQDGDFANWSATRSPAPPSHLDTHRQYSPGEADGATADEVAQGAEPAQR